MATGHTEKLRKDGAKKGTQRHSLPPPVKTDRHDHFVPRRGSLWLRPQKSTHGGSGPTPGGRVDPLPGIGDLDAKFPRRNSWRHSDRSVISSSDGGSPSHWRSGDRSSLKSNGSSSSVFTRFSGSTISTLFTSPPSRTTSWRYSGGGASQKEKRFSNVKRELHADSFADVSSEDLTAHHTSGGWDTMGVRRDVSACDPHAREQ